MKTVVAFGHIESGRLVIHRRTRFDEEISKLEGDCRIEVEVGTKRSLEFNAYWWGMCAFVARELGWEPERVHEHTKAECNYKIEWLTNKTTGETKEVKVALPTHNLTTTRMLELKEAAMQYWAEQGIVIPDEYWQEKAA